MSDRDRQRKKGYMKNSCCKRKKMINHLINRVEEIETACFSKQVFTYYNSFLVSQKNKERQKVSKNILMFQNINF